MSLAFSKVLRSCKSIQLSTVCHRALFATARFASSEGSTNGPFPEDDSVAAYRRQRRTEWKRRKGGAFLDHLVITVRGGKGGDGCVAFHREKFKAFGPPSGGNGGAGGSVYIMPSHRLTSLAGISKRVTADSGGNGLGSWQHGRAGEDCIIYVPYGTVVREVLHSGRARTPWEAEEESYRDLQLGEEEIQERRRERRWVHYPESHNDNVQRDEFLEAVARFNKEEEQRHAETMQRKETPLNFEFEGFEDLSDEEKQAKEQEELTRPLGTSKSKPKGTLVAAGGVGGYGNPHFLTPNNRSPKWATRGQEGDCVTLELELKLIADIGLVGFPNAGKSTLLNALTRRRAEVASYAFTTLNPQVGMVRVFRDGSFDGADGVIEETRVRRDRDLAGLRSGIEEDARQPRNSHRESEDEVFRFTIADNPGLIADASENVGLGHDFLRSIERARALAYVVDLSSERPWDELEILQDELETYKAGLSSKCRMVIANKADLLVHHNSEGSDGSPQEANPEAEIEAAKAKLASLEYLVRERLGPLDVIPVSAKYNQNLRRVVSFFSSYVQESRMEQQSNHAESGEVQSHEVKFLA